MLHTTFPTPPFPQCLAGRSAIVLLCLLFGCLLFPWTSASAQNSCATQSIIVNTGYNPLNGTTYPLGETDGYWVVTDDRTSDSNVIGTLPRCANVIEADPVWHPAQSGSQWIASQPSYANNSHRTTFERKFCIGIVPALPDLTVNLSVLVADAAEIYIDNVLIATIPAYGALTPTPVNAVVGMVTGSHTLRVVLHDAGGSGSGIDITGTLTLSGPWMIADSCCSAPCAGADCSTTFLSFGTDETWTILDDPSGGIVPRCATIISDPYSNWGSAIPGSSWIGTNATGSTTVPGIYVFEKKFEVSKTTTIQLKLSVMADDAVDVYLDGIHILNYPNWAGSVPKKLDRLYTLEPGCHSVRFLVDDVNAVATGLDAYFEVIGEGLVRPECSDCDDCPDCETQDMRLSTNSDWTIVADPSGGVVPRCASEIPVRPPGWGAPLSGSSWIGINPAGSSSAIGVYIFERYFRVSKPMVLDLNVSVMADDAVDMYLDGIHILNYPNWAGAVPKTMQRLIPLEPGCHTLRFSVRDEMGRATGVDAVVDLLGDGLVADECADCGSCALPPPPARRTSGTPDLSMAAAGGLMVSPNPSSGTITVEYRLDRRGETRLELYTSAGELVMTLDAGEQDAGEYRRSYTPENLPAGLYLIRLTNGENRYVTPFHLRK